MNEYLLNFHHFPIPAGVKPSEKELEAVNKQWQDYIGGIAAKGSFVATQRLDQSGIIISPDGKTMQAVADGKGLIVGTLTLKASNLEEATELAKNCPVLAMGGSVELRPVLAFTI